MSKQKKTLQLGMNPSTASGRLVKDILFDFVDKSGAICHQCGEKMTRDTFSIEHKVPWLDSEDPVSLYFDLDNIAFSHLICNTKASRNPSKGRRSHGVAGYNRGCKCGTCRSANTDKSRRMRSDRKTRTGRDR